jgi:hypothetical protein
LDETRYPLCWPEGWKRTKQRTSASFGRSVENTNGKWKEKLSVWDSIQRIDREMRALKVPAGSCIVSTNIPTRLDGVPRSDRGEPKDPGVTVYWTSKAGKKQCMPIDIYDRVADNLAAVAATLESLRAIERHGGSAILDRAFSGFAQLPASIVTQRPWRDVLQFHPGTNVTAEMVRNAFRMLASKRHPDVGGSHDSMAELNAARDAALKEVTG